MAEYYLAFLIDHVKITTGSASSYLSHVIHRLFCDNVITASSELRTDRVARILKGYLRMAPEIPLRERVRIPCTINIATAAIDLIPSIAQGLLAEGLEASVALGYGVSLRPQEYLKTPRPVPITHQANSSLAFFWFEGVPYRVTDPDLYPQSGKPETFSLFLDFNKNNQNGQGGPRSIWCSPFPSGFCCVSSLYAFLKKYPPCPQSPLLSGIGLQVTTADITRLFDVTAAALGLPAGRLLPHSLRSGAIVQLVAARAPVNLLLDQGDWHTLQGLRSYAHTSLENAREKAGPLHDVSLVPIAHSVHQYSHYS
jgi:hypothetical protein